MTSPLTTLAVLLAAAGCIFQPARGFGLGYDEGNPAPPAPNPAPVKSDDKPGDTYPTPKIGSTTTHGPSYNPAPNPYQGPPAEGGKDRYPTPPISHSSTTHATTPHPAPNRYPGSTVGNVPSGGACNPCDQVRQQLSLMQNRLDELERKCSGR